MINSGAKVDALVKEWKEQGLSKAEICVNTAKAEIGWCYVWGAVAATCTPSKRKSYLSRQSEAEQKMTIKKCQVLNESKSSCSGCKYYPNGETTLMDDCQGFVKQIVSRVGIKLQGGGCTSMYKNNANWTEKGDIKDMPNKVCCVFMYSKTNNNYSHIGLHIGDGIIIHDSGEVKQGKTSDKGWTNYALIKGLDGDVPVSKPTLRIGSTGPYVVECQQDLMKLGYDLSPYNDDGKYGKKTAAAVSAFQKDRGLKADGICGPDTWAALDAAVGPQPVTDLYTVIIPHLTLEQAEELQKQYPDAEKRREG